MVIRMTSAVATVIHAVSPLFGDGSGSGSSGSGLPMRLGRGRRGAAAGFGFGRGGRALRQRMRRGVAAAAGCRSSCGRCLCKKPRWRVKSPRPMAREARSFFMFVSFLVVRGRLDYSASLPVSPVRMRNDLLEVVDKDLAVRRSCRCGRPLPRLRSRGRPGRRPPPLRS